MQGQSGIVSSSNRRSAAVPPTMLDIPCVGLIERQEFCFKEKQDIN